MGAHYAVEGGAGGNISGGIHLAPQTVEKGVFTPWRLLHKEKIQVQQPLYG